MSEQKKETHHRIIDLNYDPELLNGTVSFPCSITGSGGFGHKSASAAIRQNLFKGIRLMQYPAPVYQDKPYTLIGMSINLSVSLNRFSMFNTAMSGLGLPTLPDKASMDKEIVALSSTEPTFDIDAALILPTGFENIAIWNLLQRADKVEDLRRLIACQEQNDAMNYQFTYEYFYEQFSKVQSSKQPYTAVINTQPNGLAALCDAVKDFNEEFRTNLVIHQYMTDIATKGAIHFFPALARLTPEQQKQMKLYAVDMNEEVLNHFFGETTYFKGIYRIDPKNNPLVRPEFKDPAYDYSQRFNAALHLNSNGKDYFIAENEEIGLVMLGSQSGTETGRYIDSLIRHNMNKVFVFGGSNPLIKSKVDTLISSHPSYADKIILLGPQDAKFIAALSSRVRIAVFRGGGATAMEQLEMNHNPKQIIILHCPASKSEQPTSGIDWEDVNVEVLIRELSQQMTIFRTSPIELEDNLDRIFAQELQLNAAKSSGVTSDSESDDEEAEKDYINLSINGSNVDQEEVTSGAPVTRWNMVN